MSNLEYFKDKRFGQVVLEEKKLNCQNGKHDWSNYFTTPGGLARECKNCGKTEFYKKEKI